MAQPQLKTEVHPTTINAPLNFLLSSDGKPEIHMSQTHAQPNHRTGEFGLVPVSLTDARTLDWSPTLDGQGFELSQFQSKVQDFYDDHQVTNLYYPEIEAFLKAQTGATSVHIFDHTVRVQDDGKREEKQVRLPVGPIHNDYTEWSGPKRVTDVMSDDDAQRYLGHRFAMVNVWRHIGESAERLPLAMADAATVQPQDFVATDMVYEDRKGEIYQVGHSAGQEWYYYGDMTNDEVILLKCFDNDESGIARYTAHGAFENPTAAPGTPPRESIEVRTMISFAPEA